MDTLDRPALPGQNRGRPEAVLIDPTLRDAVLALPSEERAELIDAVLASLPIEPEIEAAWADEIERRIDDLESGRVRGIPAEQVFAEARARLRPRG